MIHTILMGRTGNNFFQYAVSKYLANQFNTGIKFYCFALHPRQYQSIRDCLERLPIKARIVRGGLPSMWANHAVFRLFPINKWLSHLPNAYIERSLAYDESLHRKAGSNYLLKGFFQTPLYFPGMREELRNDLDVWSLPADKDTVEYLKAMADCNSVACHVRRTDYLNIPGANICNTGYYWRAIDVLRQSLDNPRFFIFSDDPDWCREQFTGDDVFVCDSLQSRQDPLNDLRMMASARHNIIANSSYSWWAAYLNRNEAGQKVILPSQWDINAASVPMDEKLLPGWQLVPVLDQ